MDIRHREILRENMVELVENMVPDELLVHLHQRKVFTEYMVDSIKAEKSRYKQAAKVLAMLTKRGPDAFDRFYLSLIDTHQDYLARKLKPGIDPGAIRQPISGHKYLKIRRSEVATTSGILKLRVKRAKDAVFGDGIYQMLSRPRGLALIINNRHFLDNTGLSERQGTEVDGENLEELLSQMDYQVTHRHDLTAEAMKQEVMTFTSREEEHRRHDSAVVAVLTHGNERGAVLGTDGNPVNVDFLIQLFSAQKCRALQKKPKIFIIQACRGETRDKWDGGRSRRAPLRDTTDNCPHGDGGSSTSSGVSEDTSSSAAPGEVPGEEEEVCVDVTDAQALATRMPNLADVLVAYATIPGYVSWRNPQQGSWFIQAICEVFAKEAHSEDILSLLTKVNALVASKVSTDGSYQIPNPNSQLLKKLYFNPGLYHDPC